MVKSVHTGDIASYEYASDEFLRQRRETLQQQIVHPQLRPGEFFRKVVSNAGIAAFAVGWGVWNGFERIVKANSKWFVKEERLPQLASHFLSIPNDVGGRTHYMHDAAAYEKGLRDITRDWAAWYYEGTKPSADSAAEIAIKIHKLGKAQGFNSGEKELLEFIKFLEKQPGGIKNSKQEAINRDLMIQKLEEILKKDPQAHIGQYATIFKSMANKVAEWKGFGQEVVSEIGLATAAFRDVEKEVINRALDDNARIMKARRNPVSYIAAGTVALAAGMQSYGNAKKQKALEQESELTHIERLLRQRRRAATGQVDTSASPSMPN